MTKLLRAAAFVIGASLITAPVLAGEIKGPPPPGNGENTPGRISNGASICSFSGLNDTPDGFGSPGDPEFDPGGQTQSFGSFFGSSGFPVNSLDPKSDFLSPGFGCNPTRGPDLHGN
jgi:hypothetical protein